MDAQERFQKNRRFYQVLLEGGIPLIALHAGKKRPAFRTAELSMLKDLDSVEQLMERGFNVGAVGHLRRCPWISHDYGVLDVDHPGHGLDLSPFNFAVHRQGQQENGRGHYLFRLPPGATRRAHYCKTHDVNPWNTVLPGSVHPDGTVYQLWQRVGGYWKLWRGDEFRLDALPVMDPETFVPPRSAGATEPEQDGDSSSDSPGDDGDDPVAVTGELPCATGAYGTRLRQASHYLKYCAWPSISERRGHRALFVATSNVRNYYQLSKSDGIRLLMDCFNPRCTRIDGSHYPWTIDELRLKWDQTRFAYANLALVDPRRVASQQRSRLQVLVGEFLATHTESGAEFRCAPTLLLSRFRELHPQLTVTATAFGRAVHTITQHASKCPGGQRLYLGFRLKA